MHSSFAEGSDMRTVKLLPGLLVIALTACGGDEPDKAAKTNHVWKGHVQAVDKARQVEDVLTNREKARRN